MTLIELLVVTAIIALLASVAMTQYALYKQKATDGKMESSLHAARQAMEGYYASVTPPSYAGATEVALHDNHGYRPSDGITLNIISADQTSYVLRVCATGGTAPSYRYDSSVGLMAPDAGTCP